MSLPNYFITSLAQTLNVGGNDTSIQLSTIYTQDGQVVTTADFATFGRGVLTINPLSLSNVEFCSFTGITAGTAPAGTVTGAQRGLSFKANTQIPANQKFNVVGTPVIISFGTHNIQDLVTYMNNIAISGGANASSIVKGISFLSVDPAIPTTPIALGANDPRIPSAGSAAASVGSQGLPSSTNKFVTQDNVFDSNVDQQQTTQNAGVEFGMANTTGNKNKTQQSFIPVKTKTRGVLLYKTADTGSFTGTVTVALFADSAGNPTGSALATQTLTNVQWLALPVGEFEVDYSSEYSMVAGTTYWIQASTSTSDSSNHPNLGTNSGGGYLNGSVKYWNTTDGYVAIANIDLYFKTLEGIVSQVVETDGTGKVPTSLMPPYSFVSPPITNGSTINQNFDNTYTPGFTVKNITVYYNLLGVNASSPTAQSGIATFNGTTVVSNFILAAGTSNQPVTNASMSVNPSNPVGGGGTPNCIMVTVSIINITSTKFTVRVSYSSASGGTGSASLYVVATG